ncbi:endonuclease VII domain-containing protein [Streptomyces sp. NPDC088097]|uniref:endonuclease VII domain-containing protein n=1 Tax=Streptomyces sp. NPDC088097 TaxID=3365823 RepID=UPI00380842BB
MHYNRWRLTGDPGPASRLYQRSKPEAEAKLCSSCRNEKPKSAFHKEPRNGDGRSSQCKACASLGHRNRTLRRKYGITAAEYDALVAAQNGLCRICLNPPPSDQRGLVVDHCHSTGTVRGLLCNNCNALLGMAADDVARLRSAIDYLERSRDDSVPSSFPRGGIQR